MGGACIGLKEWGKMQQTIGRQHDAGGGERWVVTEILRGRGGVTKSLILCERWLLIAKDVLDVLRGIVSTCHWVVCTCTKSTESAAVQKGGVPVFCSTYAVSVRPHMRSKFLGYHFIIPAYLDCYYTHTFLQSQKKLTFQRKGPLQLYSNSRSRLPLIGQLITDRTATHTHTHILYIYIYTYIQTYICVCVYQLIVLF